MSNKKHSPLPWSQDKEYYTAMNDAEGHSVEVGQPNMDLVLLSVNGYPDALARAERAEEALRSILISIGISNNPASASNAAVIIAEQALAAQENEYTGGSK